MCRVSVWVVTCHSRRAGVGFEWPCACWQGALAAVSTCWTILAPVVVAARPAKAANTCSSLLKAGTDTMARARPLSKPRASKKRQAQHGLAAAGCCPPQRLSSGRNQALGLANPEPSWLGLPTPPCASANHGARPTQCLATAGGGPQRALTVALLVLVLSSGPACLSVSRFFHLASRPRDSQSNPFCFRYARSQRIAAVALSPDKAARSAFPPGIMVCPSLAAS